MFCTHCLSSHGYFSCSHHKHLNSDLNGVTFVVLAVHEQVTLTAWKVFNYGVFSGPYFPVFSPNTGKYGPEKTPYLDTFHTVADELFLDWNTSAAICSWTVRHIIALLGLMCISLQICLSKKTRSKALPKKLASCFFLLLPYVYENNESNVPSRLSLQWLCDNSYTWTHELQSKIYFEYSHRY